MHKRLDRYLGAPVHAPSSRVQFPEVLCAPPLADSLGSFDVLIFSDAAMIL